ncbi:MAG: hypothetical protein Q8L48_05985 [Archangium sp.]|nr:hypothetical protein [Archangium sp.]
MLAFAGDTAYAYPLILQTLHYVTDFDRASNRSLCLEDLKGHLERVIEQMLRNVREVPAGVEIDFSLLLAGFSTDTGRWRTWVSRFDQNSRRFTFASPAKSFRGAVFVGDAGPAAYSDLKALERTRGTALRTRPPPLDWEPLDVIRDSIESGRHHSVGGAIQMVKVYRHVNVMPYAVYSPSRATGALTVFGRRLLDYERTHYLAFDPLTHKTYKTRDFLSEPVEWPIPESRRSTTRRNSQPATKGSAR